MGSYIKPPVTLPSTTALSLASLVVGTATLGAGDAAAFGGTVRITSTAAGSSDAQVQVGSTGALRAYVVASGASYLYATGILHIDSYNGNATYQRAFGTGAAHVFQVESTTLQRLTVNGVTLGTAAPVPTSGRAVAVHTTAHGANPSLYVSDSTGNIHIGNDNAYVYVGAGSDLGMGHTGTDSYLTNITGHLIFRQSSAGYHRFQFSSTTHFDMLPNVFRLYGTASAPAATEGGIYYDTVLKKHYGHNGTAWTAMY